MLHLFIYTVAPLFEDEQISLQKPPRNHTKLMLCRCRSGVIPWRHDANLFPTVSSTSIEIEQIFHFLAGIGAAKVNQKFDVNDVDDVKLRSRWFNPWPFDSIWFPSWRSPTTFTNGHLPIPKSQKGHQQHCQVHFVRMEKFLPDFHTNPTSVSPQAGTSPKNSKVAGSQPHPARRNLDLWGKHFFLAKKWGSYFKYQLFGWETRISGGKKTWKPISQLLQSDQNSIPQTEVTLF